MSGFAWVTLATNDSYSLGALVLAHSLRQVGTAHQLAVLVTPGVTNVMRKNLADVFNVVEEVNILDSKDEANLRLLKRPELGVTFTKLHCWRLTQYEKCVFLDADVLVLVNSDELFERDEFSAAPDVGWPDCFNSGVFVYRPSLETYNKLVDFALQKGSFDGGDQGLLNAYFSDWAHKDISKHLPFIYNMCSTATYSYLPAFKYYGANAKIVHFIGPAKPWLQYFDTESRQVHGSPDLQHLHHVLQKWWDIFCSVIHPKLSPDMSGLAGAFAQFTLGTKRSEAQDALENHLRRQAWEGGNVDYLGRDSFDNIWSKICQTLSSTQPEATPVKDGAFSSDTPQTPDTKIETQDVKEPAQKEEDSKPETTEPSTEVSNVPQEEVKVTEELAPPASAVEPIIAPVEETLIVLETQKEESKLSELAEKLVEVPSSDDKLKAEAPAEIPVEVPTADDKPQVEALVEKPAEVPISDKAKVEAPAPEAAIEKEEAKLSDIIETPSEVPKTDGKSKEEVPAVPEGDVPKEEVKSTEEIPVEVPKSDDKSKEEASTPREAVEVKTPETVEVPAEVPKEEVVAIQEIVVAKEEVKSTEAVEKPAEVPKSEDKPTEESVQKTEAPKEETPAEPSTVKVEEQSETTATKPKEPKTDIPVPITESQKPESKGSEAVVEKEQKGETPQDTTTPKVEDKPKPTPVTEKPVLSEEPVTQKVAASPAAAPKAPKEAIKAAPPAQEPTPVAKPKKVSEATKAPKPEPSKESSVTEPTTPQEETPADTSTPIPKSDTKPKEIKKKKKIVKKVVKADPAEGSEGSSKK